MTTTLSTVEGLIAPNAGEVRVLGHDVGQEAMLVKRFLGISLQSTAFIDYLKVWELVRFYGGLYDVLLSRAQALDLLAQFELVDKADTLAAQLSGGQQQRLALALSIVNDPQILMLDEPTTGLDPQARRGVWDVIRQMRDAGRTVLLTTHYMDEAQELCHRVGVIVSRRSEID